MKVRLNQVLSTVAIASTLLLNVSPLVARADAPAAAAEAPSYAITDITNAQVKSVLQEKTASGWTIAAVVKLTNTSGSAVRIPDYELRGKFSDGTEYVLSPSAANKTSIPPLSYVELTYYTRIDASIDIALTDLEWVDVKLEVYPKVETLLADAPVGSLVWKGSDSVIADLTPWGTTFRIPGITSTLQYTTVGMSKQFTGQKPTYVVQLKAENPSSYTQNVPDFTISGKTNTSNFIGKKVQEGAIALNPGESKYIDFAVTTDSDAELQAFYVMLAESYLPKSYVPEGTAPSIAAAATNPVPFSVGKLGIAPPAADTGLIAGLPDYRLGTAIAVDSVSQAVNSNTAVSLEDIEWFENDGQSYKTAVAKVKFTNQSDSPIPVPQLGAEMVSSQGVTYGGMQTASTVKEILPGMGSVSTFTFTVPNTEGGSQFAFRLMEQQSGFKSMIAQLKVDVASKGSIGNVYSFYPYEMKMDFFKITNYANKSAITGNFAYSYKLDMGLDIKTTDTVLVDPASPKLLLQLEGTDGKRIASKTYSLAGEGRLMSGNQSVMFDGISDQLESPLTVKVYELVATPYGDARRLLAELKQ